MSFRWYVLRSKPNKENFLGELVHAHKMGILYPAIRVNGAHTRSLRTKPYFPGYLFVHVNLSMVASSFWLWLPGSRGLVLCEGTPRPVSDELIDAIRQKINEINGTSAKSLAGSKKEDLSEQQTNPCVEFDTIFNGCMTGNDRVRILLRHLREKWKSEILPVE